MWIFIPEGQYFQLITEINVFKSLLSIFTIATERWTITEWHEEEHSEFRERKMGGIHVGASKSCALTWFCLGGKVSQEYHFSQYQFSLRGCLKQRKLDASPMCPFMPSHPPTVLFWAFFIIHTTVPKMKFWILFNSLMLNPMTLYLILTLFQEFLPYPDLVST